MEQENRIQFPMSVLPPQAGQLSDVTFNLKDFKAMLSLCEAMHADVAIHFDTPGQPLVVGPHLSHADSSVRAAVHGCRRVFFSLCSGKTQSKYPSCKTQAHPLHLGVPYGCDDNAVCNGFMVNLRRWQSQRQRDALFVSRPHSRDIFEEKQGRTMYVLYLIHPAGTAL